MDPFFNGTGETGMGQVSFTRKNLSEPFHFLSEPFHFFRSCKRARMKEVKQTSLCMITIRRHFPYCVRTYRWQSEIMNALKD